MISGGAALAGGEPPPPPPPSNSRRKAPWKAVGVGKLPTKAKFSRARAAPADQTPPAALHRAAWGGPASYLRPRNIGPNRQRMRIIGLNASKGRTWESDS